MNNAYYTISETDIRTTDLTLAWRIATILNRKRAFDDWQHRVIAEQA